MADNLFNLEPTAERGFSCVSAKGESVVDIFSWLGSIAAATDCHVSAKQKQGVNRVQITEGMSPEGENQLNIFNSATTTFAFPCLE